MQSSSRKKCMMFSQEKELDVVEVLDFIFMLGSLQLGEVSILLIADMHERLTTLRTGLFNTKLVRNSASSARRFIRLWTDLPEVGQYLALTSHSFNLNQDTSSRFYPTRSIHYSHFIYRHLFYSRLMQMRKRVFSLSKRIIESTPIQVMVFFSEIHLS